MKAAPEEIQLVKDRLARSVKLRQRLAKKCDRLDALELQISSPSSPRLDGMPRGGTPKHDRLADMIASKLDLEAQIREIREQIRKDARQLAGLFEDLPPKQELVCCLRYVDGLSWPETIAAMYDGADDWEDDPEKYQNITYKEHGKALASLALIMKERGILGKQEEGGDEE